MAIESTMLALGTPAPPFTLPEPATGGTVSLDELTGPALVVTFICNHCPYVKHVAARARRARPGPGRTRRRDGRHLQQ